ncbi:hypothetical protein B0J17DRAFT_52068 [Rhizoctonia solani]|nr:hypothetical protein B0J17DRAFT_52068 [Rhizoctonia solani]
MMTNNAGTGADDSQLYEPPQVADDRVIRDAIERSNRLAEQANQLAERSNLLIERSNKIAERANQLVERSIRPPEQPNLSAARLNDLYEQLNTHYEASNQHHGHSNALAEESAKPVRDMLRNINKVLVGIQHAIVRSHKGNTLDALDSLVNVKGETPGVSGTVSYQTFKQLSGLYSDFAKYRLSFLMSGITQGITFPNTRLGKFLGFYGIGDGICLNQTSSQLRDGKETEARERLSKYLSSCVG